MLFDFVVSPPLAAFFFALFSLEMVINCVVRPAYFLSSFFLLDLVSAFSLIPDIPWLWNPMIGLNASDFGDSADTTDAALEVERIKRISKNGQKLLQILKFVKLIRLGRIAKLFEMAQRTIKERARQKKREARKDDNTIHADDYTQSSQVGQSLSEQTIRNVVTLVLLMLFGIPLLEPSTEDNVEVFTVSEINRLAGSPDALGTIRTYQEADGTYVPLNSPQANATAASGLPQVIFTPADLATMLLHYDAVQGTPINKYTFVAGDVNVTYLSTIIPAQNLSVATVALQNSRAVLEQQFQYILSYYSNDTILYLRVRGQYYANDYQNFRLFNQRTSEMKATDDSTGGGGTSVGVFSTQALARLDANYSIWRTFTTLLLLFIGAVAFDYNNKRMVIVPIERMVATIVQLRKNPLAKAVLDDEDGGKDEEAKTEALSNNETGMLERTLQKLTGLLQVGFGDAGSRMIQKCMQQNSEGDLDPLVDGTRMLAIFGFCDIRRFTDATECLREDVMMYVNEIAAIVHSHVSICDGHPNKNVGDAFLVMWRLSRQWRRSKHTRTLVVCVLMLMYFSSMSLCFSSRRRRVRHGRSLPTERDPADLPPSRPFRGSQAIPPEIPGGERLRRGGPKAGGRAWIVREGKTG
jgi:hypothetical protein